MEDPRKTFSRKESTPLEEKKESISRSEVKEHRRKLKKKMSSSRSRSPILRSNRKDSSKLSQNHSDPKPKEAPPTDLIEPLLALDQQDGEMPLIGPSPPVMVGQGLLGQDEVEVFNAYDHVGKSGRVTP